MFLFFYPKMMSYFMSNVKKTLDILILKLVLIDGDPKSHEMLLFTT